MPRIVDLTMPVADHFRWAVDRRLKGDLARGDPFQITWIGWTVHGFTHIDAPRHMVPGGPTTSDIRLEQVVGEATVIDLTAIAPDTPVTVAMLEQAGAHIRKEDIILLKTGWDRVESAQTPEFWTRAPYMTREGCEWLLARGIRAIGFDFPQDYPIRGLLTGKDAPMRDFVTHDVLLRAGVIMIEYLCNMGAVKGPRTQLFALPLKIPDADGAPARVIALEPD
jgi:arylformamidase